MLLEKQALSLEELESQVALDLPDREMLLVTVIITDVLNNLSVNVEVKNNNVAVQVCAVVGVLANLLNTSLDCDIQQ